MMKKLSAALTLLLLLALVCSISEASRSKRPCTRPGETSISYRGDGEGHLPQIYDALATCPNITSLELDLTMQGCVVRPQPWTFDFRDGDRFPPLNHLSLSRFDFKDDHRWEWGWRGSLSPLLYLAQDQLGSMIPAMKPSTPWPPERTLERWLRAMDFTQVEALEIDEDDYFCVRMQHELPGLRNLTMHVGSNLTDDARGFLEAIPPLEFLSLRAAAPYLYDPCKPNRTRFPLEALLARHGPALRNLRLHQDETENLDRRRLTFSPAEIRVIGAACPHLAHLGLDLDRNGTWPNATLDALAALPQLQSLSLGLELGADVHRNEPGQYGWNWDGLDRGGPFREPLVSLNVSEALFADLRAQKQGKELRQLDIAVGDYSEKSYMGPLYLPNWADGRARAFVCDAAGVKGDGKAPLCQVVGNEGPLASWNDDHDEVIPEDFLEANESLEL